MTRWDECECGRHLAKPHAPMRGRSRRQGDDELTALTETRARRADRSTVELHELLCDRQSNTETRFRRGIASHERLEDMRQHFGPDAAARVADGEDRVAGRVCESD
jgi:hypothetical protein